MKPDNDSFDAAIHAHDKAVAACGLDVWVGAEPTFTNRWSEASEWLTDALGETKQSYACHFIKRLQDSNQGAMILRTVGRQYPGEEYPRWSLGLYQHRDGSALPAHLPKDPLDAACPYEEERLSAFWQSLITALNQDAWSATGFRIEADMGLRVLFNRDGKPLAANPEKDSRLTRPAIQEHAIPPLGAVDDLAAEGLYLVSLGYASTGPENSLQPCIELPCFSEVVVFLNFLQRVAQAARDVGLSALVWRGFSPPVDENVAWTTLTPDPAVLEVNEAPAVSVTEFLGTSRRLYAIAEAVGLAPYRLQYNGVISESGGGGQFTLGGPSPERSPFFVEPQLMTRLVSYLNRHPSISYWFAPLYVGSFSQSPRPDENVFESFSELQVALQHLACMENPDPEFIWRSLSPFLVDTSGNSHRCELNIEKLWNPYLLGRGCLGLVEFRAFRMMMNAETASAIAALLRAMVVMLSQQQTCPQLIEWGSQLHDRFALPFYLQQDLKAVFSDLKAAGLGLGEPITERLYNDDWRHIGHTMYANCRLDVDEAIEFWPLLGDAAEQEGGSRLVDASTNRLQLTLRPISAEVMDIGDWQLLVNGYRVPLRQEQDEDGIVYIMGLRYRAFVPWIGLHPGIGAQSPIVLTVLRTGMDCGLCITLHDWQPRAKPYDGLPDSIEEAQRRTHERFVVEEITPNNILAEAALPASETMSDYCFDLRRT